MKQKTCLRIYHHFGEKTKNLSFWKKLKTPNFGTQLLQQAKLHDMEQALLFNVPKGYLKHQVISEIQNEIPLKSHPQCIEIVDTQEKTELLIKKEYVLLAASQAYIVVENVERLVLEPTAI